MLFISELHFLPCFMRSNVIPYLHLCHCTWHESGFDPSCSMSDHRHKQTFPLLGCHFFISCNLSHKLVAREFALTYCHTHTSLSQSSVFGIICVRPTYIHILVREFPACSSHIVVYMKMDQSQCFRGPLPHHLVHIGGELIR